VAEQPIVLRPSRALILIFGVPGIGVAVFILVGAIAAGQPLGAIAIWLSLLVAVIVVVVNYVWFHYAVLEEDHISQLKYLGFLRRRVSVSELRSVGTRMVQGVPWLAGADPTPLRPTVRLHWPGGVMEFSKTYDTGPLRAAVTFLKGKGVPVSKELQKHLKID
jgi:hypothetical protein